MNKLPLVSVIIPVYNVERYLEECVNSVLKQVYPEIEVILVNDGSTDNSENVCESLKISDNRVKYLKKSNSGLSDSRNTGLDSCTGQYVMFVDSDDVVSSEIIAYLYNLIKKYNSPIASCSFSHFTDGTEVKYIDGTEDRKLTNTEALKSFFYQKEISTSACAKLYKADIFKQVRFRSGLLFEDNDFLYHAFSKIDSVAYGNAALYGYRHRTNSITTRKYSIKDLDILKIGIETQKFFKGDTVLDDAIKAYQCSNCLRVYLQAPEEGQYKEAINYCKTYLNANGKSVEKDMNIRKKLKLALILYRTHIPRKAFIALRNKAKRWS